MALTHLTDGVVTGASSSLVATTSSVTIPDGHLCIVSMAGARNSGTFTDAQWSSLTGAGLTWTSLTSLEWGSRRSSKVWYAKNTTGSSASGTLTATATNSGATAQEIMWSVDVESDPAASTLFGTPTTNNGVATSGSVTVSGTPAAGDKVFAFFAHENASDTITLGSELDTTLVQRGSGANVRRILSAYDSAPDSTPIANASWSSSNNWGAIAVILKAGSGGPVTHATTGALIGAGAVVAGAAARSGAPVSHATSGALVGPGAVVAGAAARVGDEILADALEFAGNEQANSMARFEHLPDALALRDDLTFIWKGNHTTQPDSGYHANMWLSTEAWDNGRWSVGFHPYPCDGTFDANGQSLYGSGGHYDEIAGISNTGGGKDYIRAKGGSNHPTVYGAWRTFGVRIRVVGSVVRHTYYLNLPSVADADVLEYDFAVSDIPSSPTNPGWRFGSSPWTDNTPWGGANNETASGKHRFFKLFSACLSEADMLAEAAVESNTPVTSDGIANVYWTNINPTVADISDKSGAGNNPVWANAQRPADWSGYVESGTSPSTSHDTSGALVGQGAVIAGSASRTHVHTSSGALVGSGSVVAGSAARTHIHTSSGDLVGPGAVIVGSAARTRVHTSSGELVGPGSAVAGDAARSNGPISHATSGALVGPGAAVSGDASRASAPVSHDTSGALVGGGAEVSGEARIGDADPVGRGFVLLNTESKLWWKRKPKALQEEEASEQVKRVVRVIERVAKAQAEQPATFTAQKAEVRQAIAPIVEQMPGFDWVAVWSAIRDGLERQQQEQQSAVTAAQELARIQRMQADEDDVLALLMAVI